MNSRPHPKTDMESQFFGGLLQVFSLSRRGDVQFSREKRSIYTMYMYIHGRMTHV